MTATVLAAPHTPEWFAERRKGIGASEIAAVMGISPWESPLSLYWRKVNGWELEETEEMRTGTLLEPAIAQWGASTIDPLDNLEFLGSGLLAHPERAWELATPDRTVHWSPDYSISWPGKAMAVLECKWAGSWDGWGEEGTDDVPVYYRSQVQWQCDVVGVGEWYIAVLGPSGFRLYRGRRDDKDIAVMVEHGRRFMARIEAGDPPPIDDHAATLVTLKRLHPSLVDEQADIPTDIAAAYLRAVDMERKAKALKKRREIELREAMGDAARAVSAGRFVASRSVYTVAEHTVQEHTVDRLNPPRSKKS